MILSDPPEVTRGHLLGGRVVHDQPRAGHRTGIEPVFLAAAIPARPGQRVLEGGCGCGAALLCLAARVQGIFGVGVERDAALAGIARENAAQNGFSTLSFLADDIATFRATAPFDHACANPPWHAAGGTVSPDSARESARRADDTLFGVWASRLSAALRPRGTLTLIIAAHALPACLAACEAARCGSPSIFPLWPRDGVAAKLVLLRTVRDGRAPCRLLPGLVLHDAAGGFSAAADAVLRGGEELDFFSAPLAGRAG
jgi:tRNA1(Val) A37 N6-methylase TrmN6